MSAGAASQQRASSYCQGKGRETKRERESESEIERGREQGTCVGHIVLRLLNNHAICKEKYYSQIENETTKRYSFLSRSLASHNTGKMRKIETKDGSEDWKTMIT